ncbi:hypothetical protein WLW63_23095, partial [Bordetella bronchiseptica]
MTAMDAAMGRVMGVAFVAGTAMVQGLATLDGVVGFACLAALGALAAWRAARRAGPRVFQYNIPLPGSAESWDYITKYHASPPPPALAA